MFLYDHVIITDISEPLINVNVATHQTLVPTNDICSVIEGEIGNYLSQLYARQVAVTVLGNQEIII